MRNYKTMIILWTVIVLLSAQNAAAVLMFLTIPFTCIYLIACLYDLVFKKKPFKEIGIKLLIIVLSYSVITCVHVIRFKQARAHADLILAKIQNYRTVHGVYPESIVAVGLTNEALRKERIFYDNQSNDPVFFYPATQIPFDIYRFNFKSSTWEYRAD